MKHATWLRSALAVLSVPLLAAPSAYGVYTYLEPQSGPVAAGMAAAGFELAYIGVNVLALHSEALRTYGRNVALAAVATAVVFNTLAHYRATVPDIAHTAADIGAFGLALLTSLPLAGLAYAMSVLLHRLTEVSDPMIASLQAQLAETQHALQLSEQRYTVAVQIVNQLPHSVSGADTKREQVKSLVDSGASVSAAARQAGVARSTAHKYVKKGS